jgi:hypothetical protein
MKSKPYWLFGILCLWHLAHGIGRADEFCAITLKVIDYDGRPITSTWIELVDPNGAIVRREMIHGPKVKICDFGFGPHELRVGTNECLPVTISNLRLVVGFPLELSVILNGCGYRDQMRNSCLLFFRVSAEDGTPIEHATFSPAIVVGPAIVDSYGRYQALFKGHHNLTFSSPGFEDAPVQVECKDNEEVDVAVTMRRIR